MVLKKQKNKVAVIIIFAQDTKYKQFSKAFDNTFVVSYSIVFILSIFGLFTDRKPKQNENVVS